MPSNKCINVENDVNVKAFLKLIRYAEHGREDDGVYYVLYGGKQTFTDTSKHPLEKPITAWGYSSTSAGAYQMLNRTWKFAKEQGVAQDFTPASQDKIAIWIIQTNGAMRHVLDGKVEDAIPYLRRQWTSLPGGTQQRITMAQARELFNKYLAEQSKR